MSDDHHQIEVKPELLNPKDKVVIDFIVQNYKSGTTKIAPPTTHARGVSRILLWDETASNKREERIVRIGVLLALGSIVVSNAVGLSELGGYLVFMAIIAVLTVFMVWFKPPVP
jgi:hypothetical protein